MERKALVRTRFALLVTILWLGIAGTIVVVAQNVAHFSPWEFIIPGPDPWTWLAPLALFGTPLLLAISITVSRSFARWLIWPALLHLTLPLLGYSALIIFPKQTGYYDRDDADRQPDNGP